MVDAVTSTPLVLVLTIYFLADLRRIRDGLYRLVPARRRPRAILIGDQIYTKIGAFLLGNMLVSALTGGGRIRLPHRVQGSYALFLAIMAAVLDVVPVVGTLLAGVVVVAVALTVSVPVCLGCSQC